MSTDPSRIYADHAATTPLAPEVLEAMLPFLRENFANPSSLYSSGRMAQKAVNEARAQIAECIGAEPNEIFFTSGGSESNNWAVKGLAEVRQSAKNPRKIIITSALEHHAILNACHHLEAAQGFKICKLESDPKGQIRPETLRAVLSGSQFPLSAIACISVMLANNEIGTVLDVTSLCAIAHSFDIPFHTDAVQAVGHIPVNVRQLGVDALSASAHKFNGPKGVGFLYVHRGTVLPSLLDGGQQENGLRAGTENVAGIVGMAAALTLNCKNLEENAGHLKRLASTFCRSLQEAIPEVIFNGEPDPGFHLPGHVSFSIPNVSGEALLHFLDLKGICVSTGAACNSRTTDISHVLTAINLPDSLARGTIRVTFGRKNSLEDAAQIARVIAMWHSKVTDHLSMFP